MTEAAASNTASHQAARYEFRCWPDTLLPAVGRLQASWTQTRGEVRSDIYLLSARSRQQVVKLRGGRRLEMKQLAGAVGHLQLWTVPLSCDFPAEAPDLAVALASLGLRGEACPASATSPAHFLTEVVAGREAIRPVTVRKARALFRRGGCRAEVTRVTLQGSRLLSLAVEAPDRTEAAAAVETLALGDLPNRHYGEFLTPPSLGPSRPPRPSSLRPADGSAG